MRFPRPSRRIFFDLDGTLIDSRTRLYRLFRMLNPKCSLSFEEYWEIKRTRVNQKELLKRHFGYENADIAEFSRRWREHVEDDDLLLLDRPFPLAKNLLMRLYAKNTLNLITARQNPEKVNRQLVSWGWSEFFSLILVTKQACTKDELVRGKIEAPNGNDVFVGDTGEDIISGKKLGMRTIAVTSGFLNRNVLREYHPDLLVENIGEIYENHLL